MAFQVYTYSCLKDNFGYLLKDKCSGHVGLIDCGDHDALEKAIAQTGWMPQTLLITHHDWDHVQHLSQAKALTGAKVYAPHGVENHIDGVDVLVSEGDDIDLGEARLKAISTLGHKRFHTSYYCEKTPLLFAGDCLFGLGCGRLSDGTQEEMWTSLQKIKQLKDDTQLYCGHDYFEVNYRFAIEVEPDNKDLKKYYARLCALKGRGHLPVPTLLSEEKKANPFLRTHSQAIRQFLKLEKASDFDVFCALRARRNHFK